MSNRTLGVLALLGAILCWGPAPVITKLAIQEIPPYTYSFLRFFFAALLLLPFFLYQGHHKAIIKADLPKFLMIGLFGSGLNVIFFMSGLTRTTATSASAIFATVPLVNALAAFIFLREKPTSIRIMGIVIGLLGSLVVALGPTLFAGNGAVDGDLLGNFLVVLSVFSWVAYVIFSKELLQRYTPLILTFISFVIGAISLFPLAYLELVQQPNWYMDTTTLGLLLIPYAIIFVSIAPFILYNWGMKQTSAFEAGMVLYLNPILATMFAIPLLGEKPTPIFLVGTSLILGGVFLASAYEALQKRRGNS